MDLSLNDLKEYIKGARVSQDKVKKIKRFYKGAVNAITHKEMNKKFIELETPPEKTNFNQMVSDIFREERRSLHRVREEIHPTSLIEDEDSNKSSYKDNEPSHEDKQEESNSQSYNNSESFPSDTPSIISPLDCNIQINNEDSSEKSKENDEDQLSD